MDDLNLSDSEEKSEMPFGMYIHSYICLSFYLNVYTSKHVLILSYLAKNVSVLC